MFDCRPSGHPIPPILPFGALGIVTGLQITEYGAQVRGSKTSQ